MNHLPCGALAFLTLFAVAPDVPQVKQAPVRADAKAEPKPKAAAEEPFVSLPLEIAAEVGQFVPIKPRTNGKSVVYYPIDQGLSVFPADMLTDKRNTVVAPMRGGRFRLLAYTAVGSTASQPALTTIVVGNAPPPVDPVDPVNPQPLPRPAGFAGEVYDQAVAVKDMANAAKLGEACNGFAFRLGTTINDPATVPQEFTVVIRGVGLTSAWNPFGAWLLNQLAVRAQTIQAAKSVMTEVAVGLKAVGGVK